MASGHPGSIRDVGHAHGGETHFGDGFGCGVDQGPFAPLAILLSCTHG
ncbi:hypothetical protein [Brevibacterium sp. NPDC059310]